MTTLELEDACVNCGSVITDDEVKYQENMCCLCHKDYFRDQAFIGLAKKVLAHHNPEAVPSGMALLVGLLTRLDS